MGMAESYFSDLLGLVSEKDKDNEKEREKEQKKIIGNIPKRKVVAKAMKNKGVDIDKIMRFTKLTREQIEQL